MTTDASPFETAVATVARGGDARAEATALVAEMTLEEKLGCLDGDTDFWPGLADMATGGYHRHPWTAAVVERLGIPGIHFADGPRGCVVGPATAFPVSMARGATFDPDLEERIGDAIGRELRAVGATYTGAVCLNLLRHPGWGRAQETYGEDPHHVGELAAALTRGLQRHVLACMKHFACNSMENARFTVDVTADDRALHEVYLPHFRRVVDEGVASVMSAYNSLNGEWCGDSRTLLTEILRDEWGFEGFVITDFIFGLRDPIGSVRAGCDIEMPFRQQRAQVLADAVADGRLAERDVDRAVTDIVRTLLRFGAVLAEPDPPTTVLAAPEHRALAREASAASMVLLHNDDLLPVDPSTVRTVAVLGELAARPNLGDGGSSNVFPPEVVTPLDGIRAAFGGEVVHATDDVSIATGADLVVVVVGTTKADEGEFIGTDMSHLMSLFPPAPAVSTRPNGSESAAPERDAASEGFATGGDRRSLRLSAAHEDLIARAVTASDRVVVCVEGGSAFVMPWLETPSAVLQIWYPGLEGGHALADVLAGSAEPGGRLPFAMPRDEADLVDFDPDARAATYGLFHGQWHLDRTGVAAHRPFGFGLGYTTCSLGDVVVHHDGPVGEVTAVVANDGERDGSTVLQVYAGMVDATFERPTRRLVGFRRVRLRAGERVTVGVPFDLATLAVRVGRGWLQEPGTYRLEVGFDAAAVHTASEITLE